MDWMLVFIAGVFALGGFVKGAIGLGLPTITIGLLSLVMSPLEAAALLIVPSLLTNVWQAMAGQWLGAIVRRLWPMLAGVCFGTWVGMGFMTGTPARYAAPLLGLALIAYAVTALSAVRMSVPRDKERGIGGVVGVITGLITAATGIFVVPAVPFIQSIGLEKDELVQTLGVFFLVSTFALAVNVGFSGGLNASIAVPATVSLVLSCVGMWLGQNLRKRMAPEAFRRWFFIGMLALGAYLALRAFV